MRLKTDDRVSIGIRDGIGGARFLDARVTGIASPEDTGIDAVIMRVEISRHEIRRVGAESSFFGTAAHRSIAFTCPHGHPFAVEVRLEESGYLFPSARIECPVCLEIGAGHHNLEAKT